MGLGTHSFNKYYKYLLSGRPYSSDGDLAIDKIDKAYCFIKLTF